MTKNRTIAVDRTAPAHRLYLRHLRGHPHLTIGPESDRSQSDRDTLAPNAAIASQSVRLCAQEKKSVRIYTSMHSGGVELTKLTYKYSGHEDNLPGHRGDEADYMLLMVSGFSTERGTYACQAIYCCRPL